jgi:ketosteroid isomerase-like protein
VIDPEFEAAIRATFTAFNERRFDDFAKAATEDIVESYPQSGELMQGRDNQREFHEAFPDPPTFEVRSVRRSGDLAVAEVDEHMADGSVWKDVFIFELRDGAVAKMTVYFAQPFAAPEWRRPYRVAP